MLFERGLQTSLIPKRELYAALLGCALVLIIGLRSHQSVSWDPASQLIAVKQFAAGEVPTLNHVSMPLPSNLRWSFNRWIREWPPGLNIVVYPLTAWLGLTLGTAIRSTAIAMLLCGSVGWALWARKILFSIKWRITYALSVPLLHYSCYNLLTFSCESFLFGLAPWLLLSAERCGSDAKRWRQKLMGGWWLLLEMACFASFVAVLYWLKYSSVLLSIGCVAFVASRSFGNSAQPSLRGLLFTILLFAVPLALMDLVGVSMGGTRNRLLALPAWKPQWEYLLHALTLNASAFADFEFLVLELMKDYKFNLDVSGGVDSSLLVPILALPGSAVLLWLILLDRRSSPQIHLMRYLLACEIVLLLGMWSLSKAGVGFHARYVAVVSIALLPYVLQRGLELFSASDLPLRAFLAGLFAVYFALPFGYGALHLVRESGRRQEYASTPQGLYDQWLSGRAKPAPLDRLLKGFNSKRDVWYTFEPSIALHLPGRVLLKTLRPGQNYFHSTETIHSSSPIRLRVLLPSWMAPADYFRRSIPGAVSWIRIDHSDRLTEWIGWVVPIETSVPSSDSDPTRGSTIIRELPAVRRGERKNFTGRSSPSVS